ncbi:MAG: hypothetical protein Q7K45_04810 [Nanoarchaeota archaeon]|nr:hypothetical protein [Nanoarchaeota archaeon]
MTTTTNQYYLHIIKYYYLYLPLLAILLLGSIYLFQYSHHQPLIIGPESYYHLSAYQNRGWAEYFPLGMLVSFIPEKGLILLPIFLAMSSLLLMIKLTSRFNIEPETRFLFLLFSVLTPAFLFSASTISSSMLVLFFILFGFVLMTNRNNSKYLALIPFAVISFIDLSSALILLLLLILYHFTQRTEKDQRLASKFMMIFIVGLVLLNWLFLNESFMLGPFHTQKITSDWVSDLGGMSGIGFTIILLSIIGLLGAWRRQEFRWTYALLIILIPLYVYSTQMILFVSIVVAFFAAWGYQAIFCKRWNQKTLKMFTILLVLLSICFSTVSYVQRMHLIGPSADDVSASTWMKDNIGAEKMIVALPEEGYYLRHFAQHEPFYEPHQQEKAVLENTVLNSTYIATTFPILEEYNIGAVYVTPDWKEQYPADQGGLLFLLQNERFKMSYSSQGYEVWEFE